MREARRLGIVGWVKNRSDGSVELEALGPHAQIVVLLAWCEQGPPAAEVTQVAVEEQPPTGRERDFDVTW